MAHVRYLTSDVRTALSESSSVLEASKRLGMSQGALRKRAMKQPDLKPLWEACTKRGLARSACGHPKAARFTIKQRGDLLVEWCAKCGAFRHFIEELAMSGDLRGFETWLLPKSAEVAK